VKAEEKQQKEEEEVGVERRRKKSDDGDGGRSFGFRRSSFVPGVSFLSPSLFLSQSPSPPLASARFRPSFSTSVSMQRRGVVERHRRAQKKGRERKRRGPKRVSKDGLACGRRPAEKSKRRRGKTRAEACNRSLRSLSLSSPPLSHLHPFSPNALLFLLHFNAPEMRRVGIHRRRETEGAIVEQRGKESRENEEERKKGGDGSFFFDAALGACLLGLLAFFSTRSLSIASRRASASLSSPKLAYLSDADTRVGRYGGEEDRLRGGGGSGRLFRGVLLLLLLRSGLRCGFSASAEESRKEALQGAGSGHLFRVPVNLKRSSAFLTRKSEMRTASERERERARAFIEWGRCLSSEEEEKEEEAKSEKKKNSRGEKNSKRKKELHFSPSSKRVR